MNNFSKNRSDWCIEKRALVGFLSDYLGYDVVDYGHTCEIKKLYCRPDRYVMMGSYEDYSMPWKEMLFKLVNHERGLWEGLKDDIADYIEEADRGYRRVSKKDLNKLRSLKIFDFSSAEDLIMKLELLGIHC